MELGTTQGTSEELRDSGGVAAPATRRHILTINAEEYFHATPLSGAVQRKHLERLESRIERNTEAALALLAKYRAKATFFVLGCTAEQNPALVRTITGAGHEVASRGYWPGGVAGLTREEFRDDLRRTNDALLAAGAPHVLGYRSPRWITSRELWILDVLAEEGFLYDASIKPVAPSFARDKRFHETHLQPLDGGRSIWVVPVSTLRVPGRRVGISGGNYLRQFPEMMMRRGVAEWVRRRAGPLVFYFAPWELDADLPQISAVSWLQRMRQYRNIPKVQRILAWYFERYPLESVECFLRFRGVDVDAHRAAARDLVRSVPGEAPARDLVRPVPAAPVLERTAVSVVIPLFNEADTVAYMHRTLAGLSARLADRYDLQFVLVDDCSTDGTDEELRAVFAESPNVKIVRHEVNQGVAGAMATGIRNADHEIVASMDCDCSYDPTELENMIPKIADADLVTASPYHPDGEVVNVPNWRLFLSRNLSRMYNVVLGGQLYTYTSCFRVYRRSAVAEIELKHTRFLGVAELLIRMKLQGAKILEHPATLEARLFGVSKMSTLRTIFGHLGLLCALVLRRSSLRGPGALHACVRWSAIATTIC